jgi:bifunctional non-homologous end joining protein LigD
MPRAEVEITHPDRVLFPADKITKRDLVDYYCEVADTMLRHLKSRPLTVQRFPRGIDQQGFVQQDFADSLPDWMGRAEVIREGRKSGEGGTVVPPVAENHDAVAWLANQNCITLHAWQSRKDRLHNPDRLVFDLDPSESDFAPVRETARAVAGVLDDLGLTCYLQTTGSRGLHVVVPLRGDADFDTARQFARDVAEVVASDDPAHRTMEARKEKRDGRVYLDVMRNAYAQTAVAPYSVRARRGAPVATPPEWDELGSRGLHADRFTIRDVPKRLTGQRDPWADMSRHSRSLDGPIKRVAKLRA